MYFASDVVFDVLTCSFCRFKFTGLVKLIPDCGNSICGDCFQELLGEGLDELKRFRCRACKQEHILAEQGLPNDTTAIRLLNFKPEKKALNEKAKALRVEIRSVDEKLERLKSFDAQEEIHVYCDKLVVEVTETVESAVRHLNKTGQELLKEINDYRRELVEACVDERPPKRVKGEEGSPGAESAEARSREELATLAEAVDAFSREWAEYFTQISRSASDEEIERAQSQARDFGIKLAQLENQMKSQVFRERFLRFNPNHLFWLSAENVGELVLDKSPNGSKALDFYRGEARLLHTISHNSRAVNQVLFTPDGNLASCFFDSGIKVWNSENARLHSELKGHKTFVHSLALLSNGWLASGSADTTIKIWDERKLVRTLAGHTGGVFALKALQNGLLASASFDDTVKIWNPFLNENQLLMTMTGHGVKFYKIQLGLLSNDYLVTCSNDKDGLEDAIVRLWSPRKGKAVKKILTRCKGACSMEILSNDNVAIGFLSGVIKTIDLVEAKYQSWPSCHKGGVYALLNLQNGFLLSGGSGEEPNVKIWNSANKRLVQVIPTGHVDNIVSLSISRDGRLLASGSRDGRAKIWALK